MVDAWERIGAWCAEHAPATAAAILPPAEQDVFYRAQRESGGFNWPDSLLAFYRWCDGTERTPAGYLWPGYRPLSLVEVIETWRDLMRIWFPDTAPPPTAAEDDLERAFGQQAIDLPGLDPEVARLSAQPAGSATGQFLPILLPIAEDQSGSLLVCDRRWRPQSHHGAVAVFDREEGYARDAPWRSVSALATATATALRTGNAVAGTREHPVAVGGRLTWTTAAPDPLDQPEGAVVELSAGADWSVLPGTDLEVIAAVDDGRTQLRYRRLRR